VAFLARAACGRQEALRQPGARWAAVVLQPRGDLGDGGQSGGRRLDRDRWCDCHRGHRRDRRDCRDGWNDRDRRDVGDWWRSIDRWCDRHRRVIVGCLLRRALFRDLLVFGVSGRQLRASLRRAWWSIVPRRRACGNGCSGWQSRRMHNHSVAVGGCGYGPERGVDIRRGMLKKHRLDGVRSGAVLVYLARLQPNRQPDRSRACLRMSAVNWN
jgi:hypothetical protein